MATKIIKGFQGFWCKRCGGRVLEDDIYVEVDPVTRKKKKKVELTCLLCARNYRCEHKDYLRLLENIERLITTKKRAKNNQKPLLPEPR